MQFLYKSWLQSSVSNWLLVSQCQDHELVCNADRLCLELCAKGSLIFKYAQTNFKILPCKMKLEASCGGPIYCMFGNKSHSFAFKPVIFWSIQYVTLKKKSTAPCHLFFVLSLLKTKHFPLAFVLFFLLHMPPLLHRLSLKILNTLQTCTEITDARPYNRVPHEVSVYPERWIPLGKHHSPSCVPSKRDCEQWNSWAVMSITIIIMIQTIINNKVWGLHGVCSSPAQWSLSCTASHPPSLEPESAVWNLESYNVTLVYHSP